MESRLAGVGLVGVQHLLETTGSLVACLVGLGLKPDNCFLLGKAYSSNTDVVDGLRQMGCYAEAGSMPMRPGTFNDAMTNDLARLWDAAESLRRPDIHTLMVLDDGGRCLATVPAWAPQDGRRVCGVEQTQFGADRLARVPYPVVLVARSGVKKWIEPPMIARAVRARVSATVAGYHAPKAVGVVGLGPIGRAVAQELLRTHGRVLVFDRMATPEWPANGVKKCAKLRQILEGAEVLFGCTGSDIFEAVHLEDADIATRVLASCSSEDVEFRSILKRSNDPIFADRTLPDVSCHVGNHELRVLRCGFPINFDGSKESVPAHEIQVTRGLLLGGVLQGVFMATASSAPAAGAFRLTSGVQERVMRAWLDAEKPREDDFVRGLFSSETRARLIAEPPDPRALPEIERLMRVSVG